MPTYKLIEDDCHYDTIQADDVDEALDLARDNVDPANYNSGGTLFVDVRVCNVDDEDEYATDTVVLHPPAPKCRDGKRDSHDWHAPHAIVGGLKENPGVWGSGGGVVIREVCMHCGCERTTDTWGQNPTNGTQGHEVVSYEPGKYADEIEALAADDVDEDAA